MLLSHNFDLPESIFPQLSREEFSQVIADGLSSYPQIHCRPLTHPHWQVEVLFAEDEFLPAQVGELCAQALLEKRKSQTTKAASLPDILILAGLKQTPPLSSDPDALQPGQWGVDVVETDSGESFLIAMEWETKTADKTNAEVFKVERSKP